MPVTNYQKIAQDNKEKLLNDPEISQKNKDLIKRFLAAYDVSPAREGIFLAQISRLLKKTEDLERDMQDRDVINQIFKDLKKDYGETTIETLKGVAKQFARWLNNSETPKGFIDVKVDKKKAKRKLDPKDMVTWEDGLELIKYSPSLQIKAALMTQLDCGFRPSEFIDLNYGDVTIKDDMILFSVTEGKTGARIVWAHRCVPYFLRWYDTHPTKKKNDPLWILENNKRSHRQGKQAAGFEKYTYVSLQKRFNLLMEKAKLEKPIDFYNLRHSSCVLDKMDNVPIDLASERHGHSVEFFTNTYGRLSVEDKLQRVRNHYGEPEEKRQLVKNNVCGRCHAVNEPEAQFCRVCGVPLSVEQAAKVYEERNLVNERIARMESMLLLMAEKDPRFKKADMLEELKNGRNR